MTTLVGVGAFGEMLFRHRLAAGLSQRELADRAGLSERAVRDLERGRTARPRQHSLRAIADALALTQAERVALLAASTPVADPGERPPVRPMTGPGVPDELVGRSDELWALLDLVMGGRHRIITVAGPGGVGKSRLAAEVVSALRERTRLPVVALDLSALTDADLVADVVAEAVSGGGRSRVPALERVAAHLRDRRTVVVLDGFERLVAAAPFLADLVRRCPGLTVLATSQRPLRLTGERLVRLAPLPVGPAVQLLVRCAAATVPGFARTADNADALETICRRVDGLPLAIELAAAWLRLLTPDELVARLDSRLRVLTGGERDRPPRQRSLRATLESSLDAVGAAAGTLFGWQGVFAGGVRLADLEAVAAALGRDSGWLIEALTELVDMSILRVSVDRGDSRYTLPDTMRELACERLAAADGAGAGVRLAAATYYLELVVRWSADPGGPAASLVGADSDNLRTALGHPTAPVGFATVAALAQYYSRTGRLAEGQGMLSAVADRCPVAWAYAAQLARQRGDLAAGEALGRTALATVDPDDLDATAASRLGLGGLAVERRDHAAALAHLHAVLAHGNRTHNVELMGRALNTLGALAAEFGQLDHAERRWLAAQAAQDRVAQDRTRAGSTRMAGAIMLNLAEVALESGRYALAIDRAGRARNLLDVDRVIAAVASTRALALVRLGDHDAAAAAAREAMALAAEAGDDQRRASLVGIRCSVAFHAAGELAAARAALRGGLPVVAAAVVRYRDDAGACLDAHAELLAARDAAGAAQLLGAADQMRRDSVRPLPPAVRTVRSRTRWRCRTALGPGRFEGEILAGASRPVAELAELL